MKNFLHQVDENFFGAKDPSVNKIKYSFLFFFIIIFLLDTLNIKLFDKCGKTFATFSAGPGLLETFITQPICAIFSLVSLFGFLYFLVLVYAIIKTTIELSIKLK